MNGVENREEVSAQAGRTACSLAVPLQPSSALLLHGSIGLFVIGSRS